MCIISVGKVIPSKVTSVKQRTISTATSSLIALLSTAKRMAAVTKSKHALTVIQHSMTQEMTSSTRINGNELTASSLEPDPLPQLA